MKADNDTLYDIPDEYVYKPKKTIKIKVRIKSIRKMNLDICNEEEFEQEDKN